MSHTFLVSAVGGDIGYNIVKLIRDNYCGAKIIGIDMQPDNIGMVWVDQMLKVPAAFESDYISTVERIICDHQVDIFIPSSEQELKALAVSSSYQYMHKTICMAKDYLVKFLDKMETNQYLKSKFIDVPDSENFSHDYAGSFPVIVKAKEGRGSQDVHLVNSREELLALSFGSDYMIQEYVGTSEDEFTCGVYKDKNGYVHKAILRRKLVGDATGIAVLEKDAQIDAYIDSIARAVECDGAFNIQLRLSDRGPLCFEINPRISSTVAMRDLIGFKDLCWTIDEFFGKEVDSSFDDKYLNRKLVRVPAIKVI